jgi:uncharacterized protein YjdB
MKKNYIFGLLAIMLFVVLQINAKTNVTNYVLNPSFELDNAEVQKPLNWNEWSPNGTTANGAVVAGADAHSGNYYGRMAGTVSYNTMTYQSISGLPAGTYTLTGWFRSSGGQGWGNMSIKNYGGAEKYAGINSAMSTWTQKTISNIVITTGTCEIDIYNPGAAGQWTDYDDIELTLVSATVVPVTGISLNPTTVSVDRNATAALTATIAPADASNKAITWSTSNSAVATVSTGGVVTGVSAGTATITATTQDGNKTATCNVTVTTQAVTNYVLNPGFEADNAAVQKPTSWSQWLELGTTANLTLVAGDAHSGGYYCKMQGPSAPYKVMTYQTISNLPAGTYTLKGWFRCSGGQGWGNMSIKNYGGSEIYAGINSAMSAWTQKTISNINITTGTCEIDIYNPASAGQWTDYDDIELTMNAPTAIPTIGNNSTISIYPTVISNNVLNVSNVDKGNYEVNISNINGQMLYTNKQNSGSIRVNTSFLKSGLYLVRVSNGIENYVQKVVIP